MLFLTHWHQVERGGEIAELSSCWHLVSLSIFSGHVPQDTPRVPQSQKLVLINHTIPESMGFIWKH